MGRQSRVSWVRFRLCPPCISALGEDRRIDACLGPSAWGSLCSARPNRGAMAAVRRLLLLGRDRRAPAETGGANPTGVGAFSPCGWAIDAPCVTRSTASELSTRLCATLWSSRRPEREEGQRVRGRAVGRRQALRLRQVRHDRGCSARDRGLGRPQRRLSGSSRRSLRHRMCARRIDRHSRGAAPRGTFVRMPSASPEAL